jgi:uncharacterized protein (DUF1778 family)
MMKGAPRLAGDTAQQPRPHVDARAGAGRKQHVLTLSIHHIDSWPIRRDVVPQSAQAKRKQRETMRKDDIIQIRASASMKAILNRAAALRGQKLSEFMLDSARRQAEETLLDQRTFFLDTDAHAKFLELLDTPTVPSAELSARMRRKPAWER